MARHRNSYRHGTVNYEGQRLANLKRSLALAEGRAARAVKPEAKRRAQRQAATARRAIRQMPERISKAEKRREFRERLGARAWSDFNRLPTRQQQEVVDAAERWPNGVPWDQPDPFEGPHRNISWRALYGANNGRHARRAA
jgi:hypothetical protein